MKRRKLITAIALSVAITAASLTGCRTGSTDSENTSAAPDQHGTAATGEPSQNTDQAGKDTSAPWEERTMEELLMTGAVTALTASDKVYNALELGVPSDGTDASQGIRAAIDGVLEKGGGILYFPAGRYRIMSPLVIDQSVDGWICLSGDPAGETRFVINAKTDASAGAGITVSRNNTHFSFLTVENGSYKITNTSVTGSGCSFYGCIFTNGSNRSELPCLEISGSFNTVRQCGFNHQNTGAYQVEFTKYPGVRAYGNVMCDVHFGGSYTKCTLVSSKDDDSSQEALTIARNLYLIPADPMIEVRSVNGLLIANNMLDAAATAVEISPGGTGVHNVDIRDNYMGGSRGGVRMIGSDSPGANISVHDNYIWAPDSMTAMGKNYSGLSFTYNYCVLTGGQAVYVPKLDRGTVSGDLVVNLCGANPELEVSLADKSSVIDTAGFGSSSVPGEKERVESFESIPSLAYPKADLQGVTPNHSLGRPDTTGDTLFGEMKTAYYSVKDYGASGDGVTDDTQAVKKCITAALKTNGTVYFPEGQYLITSTVKLPKDDSKVLTFKGDGSSRSCLVGASGLEGPILDVRMKYNFNAKDLGFNHQGQGSCVDALYIKAFDCAFTSSASNPSPLLSFHGSNCWTVRCRFHTANQDSYGLTYTRLPGEISINDFITDNTFTGPGKGVLVGDGVSMKDGRCEGLKIHGNTFQNTGATQVEIYEILHVNVAYNRFEGAKNPIFLSNQGHGPDGIYVDHNTIKSSGDAITSGRVEGGGDYISMVVIHDNTIDAGGEKVSEPVPFNKKMVRT